ncbi:MAG: sugar phosphate isomerase/epimerase [Clostridiales bacterium]|nr:sugar phosphate isomerase/epimerase [Clostridiales bacterium]
MKTSVSFFTFGQEANIPEACREVRKAGYDGVELVLTEKGPFSLQTGEREMLSIRSMIEDMGLSVSGVGAWPLWQYNLAADDSAQARDVVKKAVDSAQALGTDAVLVVPGWVGSDFAEGVVHYERAYENAQRALRDLSPYAQAAGVHLAVENVWNKFLLSPLEMRRFLDEIGSDFVGAYFDVGNIIYIGYPEQWIEILGKRIRRLHFCDCRGECAGLSMFVDLFEGDVDFHKVMRAVHKTGYDSWATIEFLPNYRRFPFQSIINARLSLERVLEIRE